MSSPYEVYLAKQAALKAEVSLRPHQHEAVQSYMDNDGQLLDAHDTGTGKTLTAIAQHEAMKAKGRAGIALAVTPATLRGNFIEGGVHHFTDQHGVMLGPKGDSESYHIDSPLPKADYYAVSYDMFRKDPLKYIKRTGADTIIADEIHKARDRDSQNYQSLMLGRQHVKNFIGLTGTPVMNHPHDLVPIMDIVTNKRHGLAPQRGKSRQGFDKAFIEDGNSGVPFLGVGAKEPDLKNKAYLTHALSSHIHRVPFERLGSDMPAKHLHDVEVEMSPHQQELYHFAMQKVDPVTRWKIRNNMPVGSHEASHVFSMISQARQASNAMHTLDAGFTPLRSARETPKPKRLIEDVTKHLAADPKHKALIYTNLVHGGVDQLMAGLRDKGHDPAMFVGSKYQKHTDRDADLAAYKSGKKRVMVINQAGTEGLDLPGTTAHYTMDPHFNPMMIEQAEARGIRAGSPVPKVDVYRYRSVMPKRGWGYLPRETSVDEWVQNVADSKTRLNDKFMGLMPGAHGQKAARLAPGEPGYARQFAETLKAQLGQDKEARDWKTLPGVRAVVQDDEGRVLLLKRPHDEEFHPGTWNLPGGAKEPGEGFLAGAKRELKEETGLTATPTGAKHDFRFPGGRGEAFAFTAPKGKLDLAKDEVAQARWVDPQHLPKKLFPQTASIVEALSKSAYSRYLETRT